MLYRLLIITQLIIWFVEPKWIASKHYRTIEGMEINTLVFYDGFWNDVEEIIDVTKSPVKVLWYLHFFDIHFIFKFHLF
jgi:hypothetical protein